MLGAQNAPTQMFLLGIFTCPFDRGLAEVHMEDVFLNAELESHINSARLVLVLDIMAIFSFHRRNHARNDPQLLPPQLDPVAQFRHNR
jgi:hypothetical protein